MNVVSPDLNTLHLVLMASSKRTGLEHPNLHKPEAVTLISLQTSSSPFFFCSEIIDLPEEVTWIKANVNSSGFYRVFYDSHTLLGLVTQLEGGQARFSPADRAGLIDDTFHLARYRV